MKELNVGDIVHRFNTLLGHSDIEIVRVTKTLAIGEGGFRFNRQITWGYNVYTVPYEPYSPNTYTLKTTQKTSTPNL